MDWESFDKRRVEELKSYEILDTAAEKVYDEIVELASQICKTPIALISLLDDKRQWFKAVVGLSVQETERNIAFCDHAIRAPEKPFVINNALNDVRFSHNPLVLEDPNIRFYAGVPLVNPNNFPLGTLCVIDYEEREISKEQLRALEILSHQVINLMEHRLALKNSAKNSRLYTNIVESLAEGVIVQNSEGEVLVTNNAATRILQTSKEKITQIDPKNVKWSFFDAQNQKIGIHPAIHTLKTGESRNNINIRIERENQDSQWIMYNAQPLKYHEEIVGVVSSFFDISETKKLESELNSANTFFNIASDLLSIAHIDGFFKRVSPSYKSTLGWEMNDFLIQPFINFVHPDDIEKTINEVSNLAAGNKTIHFVNRWRCKDGSYKSLSWFAIPSESGFLYSVARDVTEQILREKELVEARESEAKANNAKTMFLANMSHEIRTPLNGVIGISQILLETNLDEQQRELVNTSAKSGESLLKIVNAILDFTKIEANKLEIEHLPFSLAALLQTITRTVFEKVKEKNLTIHCHIDPKIPLRIIGDNFRIEQILSNFLSNAAKFTSSGHIILRCDLISNYQNQTAIRYAVSDTGIGLDLEQQSKLFTPFSQADSSTTRKFGGTGLGLSISKRLAELMGGEIGVRSEPGRGSIFHCTIPFIADNEQIQFNFPPKIKLFTLLKTSIDMAYLSEVGRFFSFEVEHLTDLANLDFKLNDPDRSYFLIGNYIILCEKLEQIKPLLSRLKLITASPLSMLIDASLLKDAIHAHIFFPLTHVDLIMAINSDGHRKIVPDQKIPKYSGRVLVAEDNATNQMVIQNLLTKRGLSVDLAQNGVEACEKVSKAKYDLILMDSQMPIMDGVDATREIRKFNLDIPIIALTANVQVSSKADFLHAGTNDFLGKPIDVHKLDEVLSRFLR